MLELDHVLCFVEPGGDWADRLTRAGWGLDAGSTHPGQGSRNRRCPWGSGYLELIWVHDLGEAAAHPLRLDRRARWQQTRASPFGFGFRGHFPPTLGAQCWTYAPDPALRFSIHRDNAERPELPLLFCMDLDDAACLERRERVTGHAATVHGLTHVDHAAPVALPPGWADLPLPLSSTPGPAPRLTLRFGAGGAGIDVTAELRLEV
jgi:hypothetical protein